MKIHHISWFLFIAVVSLLLAMCSKPSEPEFDNPYDKQGDAFIPHPDLMTLEVDSVRALEAWSGGEFTNDYGHPVTAKGVCWSTEENPTIEDTCTNDGEGLEAFESHINELKAGRSYYLRAYATNTEGTVYGEQRSFTTRDGIPQLSTAPFNEITPTSAKSGGEITDNGGSSITARGVCWNTLQNPTTDNFCTNDGTGTGSFTSNLTNLNPDTQYYVRSYATNNAGIAYGDQQEFRTSDGIAELSTTTISDITTTTARSGGSINNDGGAYITERGVCWSTSQNPTINDYCTSDGSGTGNFTSTISNLNMNTRYYIRSYATNEFSTGYGNQREFRTLEDGTVGTVTDFDGNIYKTIYIGEHEWMAENLRTKLYNDGSVILNITDASEWRTTTTGAWAYYNNDASNVEVYGKLYNYYATGRICPNGWSVPNDSHWKKLERHLGMQDSEINFEGRRGGNENVGGKMKATGTRYWVSPNTGATDSSGFSGLPGGYRDDFGWFVGLGRLGIWRSSDLWHRSLDYNTNEVQRNDLLDLNAGLPVRCVRD